MAYATPQRGLQQLEMTGLMTSRPPKWCHRALASRSMCQISSSPSYKPKPGPAAMGTPPHPFYFSHPRESIAMGESGICSFGS